MDTSRQDVRHVHIVGIESRAGEHSAHFHLAVDALFAQDCDRRPRAALNKRRSHIVTGIVAQSGVQAGIVRILETRIFLPRTVRIIAQRLHAKRHLAPAAMQRDARAFIDRAAIGAHPHLRAPRRLTHVARHSGQAIPRENELRLRGARCRNLDDGA